MKISREKLFALDVLFNRLGNEKTNVKFHYTLAKNKRLLVPEIEALKESRTTSDEYNKFQEERIELCKEYCKKDDNGNPVILDPNTPQSRYDFEDDQKELLDKEIKPLTEKYKEAIDEQDKKEKEFFELLEEEVEIPFYQFNLKYMPESVLGADVELLFDLIEE